MVLASRAIATLPPASRSPMIPEPTTAATRNPVPRNSAAARRPREGLIAGRSGQFPFGLRAFEGWQAEGNQEQLDSALQNRERVAKGALHYFRCSGNGRRVRHAPVRGHGLSRPQRARFPRGVIANREHKIHLGSIRPGKLVPAFAPQARRREPRRRNLFERLRMNPAAGMAARAIRGKVRTAPMVENRLPKDGARGIARA